MLAMEPPTAPIPLGAAAPTGPNKACPMVSPQPHPTQPRELQRTKNVVLYPTQRLTHGKSEGGSETRKLCCFRGHHRATGCPPLIPECCTHALEGSALARHTAAHPQDKPLGAHVSSKSSLSQVALTLGTDQLCPCRTNPSARCNTSYGLLTAAPELSQGHTGHILAASRRRANPRQHAPTTSLWIVFSLKRLLHFSVTCLENFSASEQA